MSKPSLAPIIGSRLRLRLLTAADLPLTLEWRNQTHIRSWFLSSAVISAEQHATWFTAYSQKANDFVFVIEETHGLQKDLHRPVGQISLYNIDWRRRWAEYGRLLIGEPAASRQGLATEATQLLLTYAFDQLGLETLQLEVRQNNYIAIGLYQKCGFYIIDTDSQHGVHTMRLDKTAARA